jgi:hypothetical protein
VQVLQLPQSFIIIIIFGVLRCQDCAACDVGEVRFVLL